MTGPTFKAWLLAQALRAEREKSRKTQKEAAAEIECSPGKIAHLESMKYLIKKTDLESLLRFYGSNQETREKIEKLRIEANEPGWYSAYSLPEGLATYVGLEAAAEKVKTSSLGLIHGLLQIEEYARAIHSLSTSLSPQQLDQRIETRIYRQTRLIGSSLVSQIELHTVMSEAAIRTLEHTNFAEKQLRKLLERTNLNNVTIQIMPFSAGLHHSMMAGFNILSFPGQLPEVAYEEDGIGGHVIDEPNILARLEATFNKLCDQAMSPENSRTMIAETLHNTRRKSR